MPRPVVGDGVRAADPPREFARLGGSFGFLCGVDLPDGFRGRVQRSTLADANEQRDWQIYADWAQALIRRAGKIYASEPFALDLDQTIYALDATVIDLCLTLFPWAHFRRSESAIKLHTLLDSRGSIPTFLAGFGSQWRAH